MSKNHSVEVYENQVSVRFQLYNALFSTLPFEELEELNGLLPVMSSQARTRLSAGASPLEIVDEFLSRFSEKDAMAVLFRLLQTVERQITLFDAVEDSAVGLTHDLHGPGTLEHLLDRVIDSNKKDALFGLYQDYRVRIVLTAHPTQFYPDPVLGILRDLVEALKQNNVQEVRLLLFQLGRTQFRNHTKPTPLEEAKSVLWFLEHNFYPVVADIQKRAGRLFSENAADLPPLIEIGFWPGGDRDGNPFVTSEVTRNVAAVLKNSILGLYLEDARKAMRRLTFPGVYEPLVAVAVKLQNTLDDRIESGYERASDLLFDLENILRIVRTRHQGLFAEVLEDLCLKIRQFGFHFASMDLRQDSRIHERCLVELMPALAVRGIVDLHTAADYDAMSETQRLDVLLGILDKPAPLDLLEEVHLPEGLTKETLLSYRAAREIQSQNGTLGLNRSIISNTQSALDLFEVLVLAHLSGWDWRQLDLDVVPLFETIDDLHNSLEIMEFLYTHPLWKQHLANRENRQPIMVGFSDGTKDGGYLGANWGIYQAKRTLTELSRKHGIQVVFFDGRGGPPARGGGNTHRFYRSMGPEIEHQQIQLTVQGQTISSNFGTHESCRFNLEQMFTAGLESFLFPKDDDLIGSADSELITELSEVAKNKYLDFKNHELFVPYLEEMTPLRYYDRLNVGSRPVKRKSGGALKLEDLRAIPFVSSWSQVKQNIPGFYGLGSALAHAKQDPVKWAAVQRLYRENLFFATLAENAMQSLSKTYFPLTAYLKNDARFGAFWNDIYAEATLTKDMLKELANMKVLLEREPSIRQSIYMREKIVLPLLVIQQYALDRVRAAEEGRLPLPEDEIEALRKLVVKSLAANINASRNSA